MKKTMRKALKKNIIALLLFILCIFMILFVYLRFFASNDKKLSGKWTGELDMTEHATVAALNWLGDIEAVSVSLEEMESYMHGLTIQAELTFKQTSRSKGTFQCNILPENYESCKQAAYEALAKAFRRLLAERLRMEGYVGSTDEEAVEALVKETFGISTTAYLLACGPALLPSLEELQAEYDGSGTYETAGGILTRQFDNGQQTVKEERYIRKGSNLILSQETDSGASSLFWERYPVIYTLQ